MLRSSALFGGASSSSSSGAVFGAGAGRAADILNATKPALIAALDNTSRWARSNKLSVFLGTIIATFCALNLKRLPLVWHARVFYNNWFPRKNYFLIDTPGAIFRPVVTPSRVSLLETDYNMHKSESTYFSDLDVARMDLLSAIKAQALAGGLGNDYGNRKVQTLLAGTSCTFKREMLSGVKFDMYSRIMSWDRKYIYVVTHFVERTKGSPSPDAVLEYKPFQQRVAGSPRSAQTVYATAIAKIVVRAGYLTVPPDDFFRFAGLLRPDNSDMESGVNGGYAISSISSAMDADPAKSRKEKEKERRERKERKERERKERKEREAAEEKERKEKERKERKDRERKEKERAERKEKERQERKEQERQERKERERQERKEREREEREKEEADDGKSTVSSSTRKSGKEHRSSKRDKKETEEERRVRKEREREERKREEQADNKSSISLASSSRRGKETEEERAIRKQREREERKERERQEAAADDDKSTISTSTRKKETEEERKIRKTREREERKKREHEEREKEREEKERARAERKEREREEREEARRLKEEDEALEAEEAAEEAALKAARETPLDKISKQHAGALATPPGSPPPKAPAGSPRQPAGEAMMQWLAGIDGWTWERVEEERVRALEIALGVAGGMDTAHDEFQDYHSPGQV